MALPKLETKTYTLTLPSTGKDIKYRPFLVKEQKILLMSQESNSDSETIDAMSQLIKDCTFGKVDPETCPLFDAEYIFLKLRSKSVGEKVEVKVTCPDDEKTKVNVLVNLEEVECAMTDNHNNIVEITDDVKVIFGYPLLSSFKSTNKKNQTEVMFEMIQNCVEEIHYGEDIYNKIDITSKELTEFFDSLNTEQFKNISDFFESMPRLRHVIEVTNPETKVKGEILFKSNFALMQHHKYSLTELENMLPWEREIYVGLVVEHVAEENKKMEEQNRKMRNG